MFPVDKVELLTLGCSGLREITPVVDHRPVNCQVIKHFLGDEPGETETGKEGVAPRAGRRRAAAAARASAVAGWGWGWGGLVGNALLGGLGSSQGRGHSQVLAPISGLSSSLLSLQRLRGSWDIAVAFPAARAQKRLFVRRCEPPGPFPAALQSPGGLGRLGGRCCTGGVGGAGREGTQLVASTDLL